MSNLKATSQKKFSISGTGIPNKVEKVKGYVNTHALNVRVWVGKENDTCSFSPLHEWDKVSICDSILSPDGKPWFYIKFGSKYGFVNSEYVSSDLPGMFLAFLYEEHLFIKQNYKYFEYHYVSAINNNDFQYVKDLVAKKSKIGITCLVPISWALGALGIKRKDGKHWVSGANGSFKKYYTGEIKDKLSRITTGSAIGKTVMQAVNAGLLKRGDIIAFEGLTHTFVYTGNGCLMYDGGHANGNYSGGIMPDYSKHYKNRKINEILRWK